MIDIRPFMAAEWQAYRDVRLQALKDSPDAFGSTYEESLRYDDEQWRQRLESATEETDMPVGAFNGDLAVGLAWGRIEPGSPERADLYQMWGSPEVRGQGVGRRMLEHIIAWARLRGASYMVLGITVGNQAAERLYLDAGFVPFGEPEPLRENSGKMVRNMRLDL